MSSALDLYLFRLGLPDDLFDSLVLPDYVGFPTAMQVALHANKNPAAHVELAKPVFNLAETRMVGRWYLVFKDGTTRDVLLDRTDRWAEDDGILRYRNGKWTLLSEGFKARVTHAFPLCPA